MAPNRGASFWERPLRHRRSSSSYSSTTVFAVMAPLLNVLILILLDLLIFNIHHVEAAPEEQRLIKDLFAHYDPSVRPVYNGSHSVLITFGVTLVQVMDMDERNQVLVTNVWLEHLWKDERLVWKPGDYGNITQIRIHPGKIWLPDIVLYNNADDYTTGYLAVNVVLYSDGDVYWSPPARLRSSCKVDVTLFPFDNQTCEMKFGSWTYEKSQVDIKYKSSKVDLSNYVSNGAWEITGTDIVRNEIKYPISDALYPDVTVYIYMNRRVLYYVLNIIFPCLWLNILSLLPFCLPPDSGEKITLGITVLLSYSVFTLLIAENMPETSEFVPLISVYLTVSMSVTAISVVMTVFVLKIHHVGPHPRRVPAWVRRWIIKGAGQLLRCEFSCGKFLSKRERPSLYNMSPALHHHSGAFNNQNIATGGGGGLGGAVGASLAGAGALHGTSTLDRTGGGVGGIGGGDFVHMERSQNNEVSLRLVNSYTASPDLYQSHLNTPGMMATTGFHGDSGMEVVEVVDPVCLERSMSPDRMSQHSRQQQQQQQQRHGSPPSPVWRPRFERGPPQGGPPPPMTPTQSPYPSSMHHSAHTAAATAGSSASHHQPPRVLVHQPSSSASETTRQRQSTERLLSEIVAFLRILIAKSDETESKNAMIDEWRQVAEVVDKFLFFVFLSATGCFVSYFLVFVPLLT